MLGYFWISHGKARGVSSSGGGRGSSGGGRDRRRVQLYRRGQQDAGDGAFTCFFRHPPFGPPSTAGRQREAAASGPARILGSGATSPVLLRPPVHAVVVAEVVTVRDGGGCSVVVGAGGRGGCGGGGGAVVDFGLSLELRAQLDGGEGVWTTPVATRLLLLALACLVRDGEDVRVEVLLAFVAGHVVGRRLPAAEATVRRRAGRLGPGERVGRATAVGLGPRLAEVGALWPRRPLGPQALVLGLPVVGLLVLLVDGVVKEEVGGGVRAVLQGLAGGAALGSILVHLSLSHLVLPATDTGAALLCRAAAGKFGGRRAGRGRH